MIKEGTFREDLFYRISVLNVKLPPLRERKEDIIPISLNYLERLKTKMTTPLCRISPEAEQAFLNYSWPGNIRELQNVVEYAANLCDSDTLTLSDLPEQMRSFEQKPAAEKPKEASLPDSQEKQILDLLSAYGHTLEGKKKIAEELGISLRTLYRKLNKMNL